jgi:hypothetical protein
MIDKLRIAGPLALAGIGVILFAFHQEASGHDFWINHSGYKNLQDGTHCCGEGDCFEFPAEDVGAQPGGWFIKSLGELVPYSDTQASEDGKFWRCKKSDGTRRCFFAPAPSS